MTLQIRDEKHIYRLVEAMRNSIDFDDTCYFLDMTDELDAEYVYVQEIMHWDPLEVWLKEEIEEEENPMWKVPEGSTPKMLKRMWKKVSTSRCTRKKPSNKEGSKVLNNPCVSPFPSKKFPYPSFESHTYCMYDFQNESKEVFNLIELSWSIKYVKLVT